MAKDSPFEEEFTPEEEAALNDVTVPPAEEEGEGSVDDALAEAGQAKPAEPAPSATEPGAAPAEAPKPAAEAAPVDPALAEEAELAAFLEKHKDKPPEELLRLAFQQTKRANKEATTNRQVRTKVNAVAERVRRAAERREQVATALPDLKEKFKAKLAEDPDAATAEMFEALLDSRLQEADATVQAARVEEALTFADEHIPEFGKNWPMMHEIATEVGYSDEELNAIDDGRPLVVMYLASLAGRLMKAGIMDRFGNITNAPTPEPTPLDPRLAAPDPQRTLGGGARGTRGAQTTEQQLAEIANMSDEEFEKLDPAVIDALLKAA